MRWTKLERWSVGYNQLALTGIDLSASRFPVVPLKQHLLETMNGYCIKPVSRETPHKMLKLNALTPDGLDLRQTKFVDVPDRIASTFSLRAGNLLVCRSVGSFDHIAKCAVVEQDQPDTLFPDIIIRVQLADSVLPDFVAQVFRTRFGRSYFQSNARTAVGMWKIGSEDIQQFPLPLPPINVQREIMRRVEQGKAEIATLRNDARRRTEQARAEVEAMILGTRAA